MARRILTVTVLLFAGLTASASAATVRVERVEVPWSVGNGSSLEWRVIYDAAPGERNDLRLSAVDDFTARVHDKGAPVAAGERCRAIDANTAECAIERESLPGGSPYLYTAAVEAGDMNDLVRIAGRGLSLIGDGGPGDDALTGSRGGDVLDGGGGNDRLSGRGGGDTLADGDRTGAADADILDGGEDAGDTVDYSARTADLVVDVTDDRGDGERGEGDRLLGMENILGGSGDDDLGGGPGQSLISGGAGDDHLDGEANGDLLEGGPGNDRLHGQGGNDRLVGGEGRDRLRGDRNDDIISAPTSGDRVSCGQGTDSIRNGRGIFVHASCEGLGFEFRDDGKLVENGGSALTLDPHPALSSSGRTLRFTASCNRAADSDGTCDTSTGSLRVSTTDGATTLGSGTVKSTFGGKDTVVVLVRLNATGRRIAARRGTVRAQLRGQGMPAVSWTVRPRR